MVTIRWITPGCLNVNTSLTILSLFQAVLSGNTEVPARNLHQHIQNLMQTDPGDNVTPMELEFKNLANVKAEPARFVSASLQVNKFKNRLVNILPFESSRVCLQPLRGIEGSDYINASFIDGYRYRSVLSEKLEEISDTISCSGTPILPRKVLSMRLWRTSGGCCGNTTAPSW